MMLNDRVRKQVKKELEGLKENVNLVVFTQKIECQFCSDTRELAEEVAGLSDRIRIHVFDFEDDEQQVKQYRIDKIPAIAVTGERDYGIRFYGIPGGYEFTSLLESIRMIGSGDPGLSDETKAFLDSLQREVHFQVFVTPTCPYCPQAVVLAHRMAFYSDQVRADMVEVTEFPQLGVKYEVQGVPRTVINESIVQEGAAPEQLIVTRLKEYDFSA